MLVYSMTALEMRFNIQMWLKMVNNCSLSLKFPIMFVQDIMTVPRLVCLVEADENWDIL